jgi:hypothetical protein
MRTLHFTERYGICNKRPVNDRAARRHLPATLLDPLVANAFKCRCPGETSYGCLQRATEEDRLCDECRENCLVYVGDRLVSVMQAFGGRRA